MSELTALSAREAVRRLQAGEVSPLELIDAALARIAAVDPTVNAVPTLCIERARDHARRIMAGEAPSGLLAGLPVLIKDLVEVAGVRTTHGSPIFQDHVPAFSAFQVERIEAQGGVVLGKTNTPEFGAGANTFNEVFGITRNPWNTALTCGGSSGGAAVTLATGMAWLADGSDLGGSLRTPATFCGVVGLRPSPGRVGLGPRGLPFDTLAVNGPMARTVGDVALLLDAQSGLDTRDPLSLPAPDESFVSAVDRQMALGRLPSRFAGGCRIAFSPDLGLCPVDPEVVAICAAAMQRLEKLGARVDDKAPDFSGSEECFQVLRAINFAATVWPRIQGKLDVVKKEVIWNAEKGLKHTGPEIAEARRQQGLLYNRIAAFFEHHDFLALPTVVAPPFDHRTRYLEEVNGRKFDTYISWLILTFAVTLTGTPAISVPAGFTRSGLPVGLQIVARPRGDAELLALSALLEADLNLGTHNPVTPK